jgi:hypothetical protein
MRPTRWSSAINFCSTSISLCSCTSRMSTQVK